MMEHAVSMLQLQGHSGDVSKVMMIGDRFALRALVRVFHRTEQLI